jgi:aminopeptidase N
MGERTPDRAGRLRDSIRPMPGQNLTRDEAAARSAVLAVQRYEIWLDLTGGLETFRSRTVVSFTSTDVGGASFADLIAPRVAALSLNGAALEPAQVFTDSRVRLDGLQATNELVVDAECAYMRSDEGLHRFVDPVDDRTYLWSQFEAADARRVFACFEQPDLKASFTLHVTAPADWTVVSNAATPEPVDLSPGDANADAETGLSRRWDFAPTEPMATYLLAVVAGPYHRVTDTYTGAAARIPLGWLCRQSLARHLDADELFAFTKQGLAHYEHRFATPYGFTSYDQVFVPEYSGAMEHPGCVTFTEQFVFRSRESESAHAVRAIVLLHEMAHMWFGDLVTMRWWDDLWLNESFADWAAYWSAAEATRFTDAWVEFALDKGNAYRADQLSSTHPIAADVVDLDTAESVFDGITYGKGASVLRQLVAWVGEQPFLAGLRAYFAEHAYGNAEFADLLRALEASSGRPLADWATAWLGTAGVNRMRLVTSVADGRYTAAAIEQSAAPEHPTLRPHRMALGLFATGPAGGLVRTGRIELDVRGPSTQVPELVGAAVPDLVLLNDGDLTFVVARLDERSLATLTTSIDGLAEPLARAMVWTAAWNMTRDGELPASAWVDLALRGLATEVQATAVEAVCSQTATAVQRYTDPAARDRIRARWTTGLRALLAGAEAGSDVQLLVVRALAASAVADTDAALLTGLLNGTAVPAGLAVDTDLRWRVLTGLARLGRVDEGAIEDELRTDPTTAGREHAAAASAARPAADAKERAWAAAVARVDTAGTTRVAIMRTFWQAGDAEVLAGFAERYFTEAASIWARATSGTATDFLTGMFPAPLASAQLLDRAERLLARPGLDPSARRFVGQGRDDVVRALAAQACDRSAAAR